MKSKNFREMINQFSYYRNIEYDSSEYQRLYRQYNRINKRAEKFFSKNDNGKNPHLLKEFLFAIYFFDESCKTFTPTPASFLINRLLYEKSDKKKYDLTVPNKEMSFFLTFFRCDSEISELLQPIITSPKQAAELEELIQAENIHFFERFKMLLHIIEKK